MNIQKQDAPDIQELKTFFENAFQSYDEIDQSGFAPEDNQFMDDWFAIESLPEILDQGALFETRDESDALVGAIFIAKQHLLSWPDGKKMEVFILGVDHKARKKGVGKRLMEEAENFAKEFGAKSIIINTHISLVTVQHFYEKLGYTRMGVLKGYYDNGDAVFFVKHI